MSSRARNWERARRRQQRLDRLADRKLGAMTDKRRRYLDAERDRLKRELLARLQERDP